MRIARFEDKGMETVTSIFLLIISSLLIISILSHVEHRSEDNEDLIELRNYQARSLGELLVMNSSSLMDDQVPNSDRSSNLIHAFLWDGHSLTDLGSSQYLEDPYIGKVLRTTPDGLSAVLILERGIESIPKISGDFISWTYPLPDGSVIHLFLSLYIGSIEIVEGSFEDF